MPIPRKVGDFVPLQDDADTTSYDSNAATFTFTGKATEQFLVFGIAPRGATANFGRSLRVDSWTVQSSKFPQLLLAPQSTSVGTPLQFMGACGSNANTAAPTRELRAFLGEETELVRQVAQIACELVRVRMPKAAQRERDSVAQRYIASILTTIQAVAGTLDVSVLVIGGEGVTHEIAVTDLSGGSDAVPGLTLMAVSLGESNGKNIAPGFHAAPSWYTASVGLGNAAAPALTTRAGGTLAFTKNFATQVRQLGLSATALVDSSGGYSQAVVDACYIEEATDSPFPALSADMRRGAPLAHSAATNGEPPQTSHRHDIDWGQTVEFSVRKLTTSAGASTLYITRHLIMIDPESVADGDALLARMHG